MATYAKVLKDTSNNQIMPYTRAKLVYMDDNSTVQAAVTTNASTSAFGRVKVGSNISVSSGTISLTKANVTNALGFNPISSTHADTSTYGIVKTTSSVVYDSSGNDIVPTAHSCHEAYNDLLKLKVFDQYNNIITPNYSSIPITHGQSTSSSSSEQYGIDHCVIAGDYHDFELVSKGTIGGYLTQGYYEPWAADGAIVGGYYTKDIGHGAGALIGLGNGTSSARSTCFYVNKSGNVVCTGTVKSSGADYAEYFEWNDSNTNNEDRRGLFVTLDGDKIKLASKDDDYILGIISGNPSVIGDSQDAQWKDQYKRDIFGAPIYSEETENHLMLNSEYDPDKEYIPRSERPEWDPVGLMGKLICIDDGTCEVNGYCYPSENGIGTKSDHGYKVMKRIDDTHIQVLVR